VVRKYPLKKSAFTLIELIFAIVVIAVSVMSLPMMNQVISSGMEKNLDQEAIFTAISEINIATTYVWDETSLIDSNLSGSVDELSRVVYTTVDCIDSGFVDAAGVPIMRRTGHVSRRCLDDITTPPYPVNATDCVDSLNAAEHSYATVFETGGTSASGYKIAYQSKLDVERCDSGTCEVFGDGVNNIDIKQITVTIQNDNNETVTLLRTYSANIGEVAYNRRPL